MTKMTDKDYKLAVTALTNEISASVETFTTLKETIQGNVLGILSLWAMSGRNTHVAAMTNALIDGLGQGINANALRQWAADHMGMILNEQEKKMVMGKLKAAELDGAAAAKVKWYKLRPQKESVYSLDAVLTKAYKQAIKEQGIAAKDPENYAGSCPDDAVAALSAMIETINAGRVEADKLAV